MSSRLLFLMLPLLLVSFAAHVRANGGAWQVGVPSTGNVAATDAKHATEVVLAEELLTIDLHQEFAAIEVRYKMQNTGGKVTQAFFFPVQRWTVEKGEEVEAPPADLEGYRITADKVELKSKNIPSTEKLAPMTDEQWGQFPPAAVLWKKSEIPFAAGQTREIVIRYRVTYSGMEGSVSDDGRQSDLRLVYSLSPAATWKGKIGAGKVIVNVLLPEPEEVEIAQPKDRFRKINETRYEWEFADLEPTLADDLKIVTHRAEQTYPAGGLSAESEDQPVRDYVIQGSRYFLLHSDFEATASSTLPAAGEKNYDVKNIQGNAYDKAWAEGAPDDGIGESIMLTVKNPLPLSAIEITPGYRNMENPSLWEKNNRVAELEITLNGDHTFSAKIPDEKFARPYPIPVRDYDQPVQSVKLVIKGVHRGTAARDTCISDLRLRAKLTEKPTFNPAR